ncbi:MAG TPA: PxKF domain-containing protein [Pyrinomonadaceae bacterium]
MAVVASFLTPLVPAAVGAGVANAPALAPRAVALPAAIAVAPSITATKSDAYPDPDNDGKAAPGETITYTVQIANNGSTDATGVVFNDTVDANTTWNGVFSTTPVAIDDTYSAVGNVRINVPAANGLTSNDSDPDGGAVTAVPGSTTSTGGGDVNVNADGSFTYNPAPGFEGADTFTYTINGASAPSNTATVTVNVAGMIWFVNAAAAPGGDGRLTSPFNTLTGAGSFDAVAADQANDNIFLYSGSYTGGLSLLSGQALIGAGSTASLSAVTGLTPPGYSDPLPATGGANPVIGGTSGISISTNNLIRGVTIANTAGTGISGTSFGTLAVADTTVNSTGQALDLNDGQLNATFQSISSDGSGTAGISLTNIAVGSVFNGGPTTITNRFSTGIDLNTVQGSISFGATTIPNQNGAGGYGVRVRNSGAAVSFASATISDANQTTAQLDANLDGIPETDGDGDAIFLSNNTGSFAVNGGALTNCGNDCVDAREASNVTLTNVAISSPGQDVASPATLGVGGHGFYALNLTGTNGLSGGSVSGFNGSNRDGVLVVSNMFSQTFNVAGTTFQNATGSTGVRATSSGTANVALNVGGATNNVATNVTFDNLSGSAVNAVASLTGILNATVQNSSFTNAPINGKNNVIGVTTGTAQGSFNVLNNTFDNVFRTASTGEGLINLQGSGTVAGNTFSANVSGNTISNVGGGTSTCGAGATYCAGPTNAILIFPSAQTNVSGTILVDGNNLTNVQQGGLQLDMANAGAGLSPIAAKIINNTFGTSGARVGLGGSTVTVNSGLRVIRRVDASAAANVLISNNIVNNGSATTSSAANAPGILVRAQNAASLDVTVTGNTVDTAGSTAVAELRADTLTATSVLCLDASGNTLAAGAGFISLSEGTGTLNVEQTAPGAGAGTINTANGIPAANITPVVGTPNYGVACAAPVASLLRRGTGGAQLASNNAPSFGNVGTRTIGGLGLMPNVELWGLNSKWLGAQSFNYATGNVALAGPADTVVRPARTVAVAEPLAARAATLFSGETVNVNIGTLPAGKSMTITFAVTIDNTINVPQVSNQGTVSGTNFGSVVTDDPATGAFGDPTVTPVFLGTPPEISCPADINVGTDPGVSTASVSFSVTATGNPTPTVDCKVGATSITSPHTFPLGETTVVCTATNGVEPDASCSFKVTVTDDEAPVIDCPDDITVNLPANSNATTQTVNFTVTATDNADATPTINTNFPSGYAFPVGTTTVTATATDDAGNQSTCQFNVTVLYNFTGFFSPIQNPPVLNEVKAGQNIPIKFSLSGNKGLSIFAAGYPASQQINCADNVPVNVLEETNTAGGSSLTYNAGSDTYQYNWKTEKSWAGTCRVLVVKLADGTEHVAYFKFK